MTTTTTFTVIKNKQYIIGNYLIIENFNQYQISDIQEYEQTVNLDCEQQKIIVEVDLDILFRDQILGINYQNN